jgi:hypothetical protein
MAGDTQVLKYIISFEAQNAVEAQAKIKQVRDTLNGLDVDMKKTTVTSNSWASAIETAAKRALYTIPLWTALRTAVKLTTDTIAAGAAEIISLDKIASRARMFGGFEDANKFTKDFLKTLGDLQSEIGVDNAELGIMFETFRKGGISVEGAMKALDYGAQVARNTMSDTKTVAQSMTDIFNVWGGSIKSVTGEQEKLHLIAATMNSLYFTSSLTVSEFNDEVRKSAEVAQMSGLSWEQMVTIMDKFGRTMGRGTIGGAAFSRMLLDMTTKKADVQRFLGFEDVNATPFQSLLTVLEKVNTLDPNKRMEALKNVFSGRALVSGVPEALLKNIGGIIKAMTDISTVPASKWFTELAKSSEEARNTIEFQLDRMKIKQAEIGAAFLGGLFGITSNNTKDAVERLKKINDTLESLKTTVEGLGNAIRIAAPYLAILGIGMAVGKVGGAIAGAGGTLLAAGTANALASQATRAASTSVATGGQLVWNGLVGSAAGSAAAGAGVGLTKGAITVGAIQAMGAWLVPHVVTALVGAGVVSYLVNVFRGTLTQKEAKDLIKLEPSLLTRLNPLTALSVVSQAAGFASVPLPTELRTDRTKAGLKEIADAKAAAGESTEEIAKRVAADKQQIDSEKVRLVLADRLKAYGLDELQLAQARLLVMTDQKNIENQKLEILKQQVAVVNEYAGILQKNLTSTFNDILSGTKGFSDIGKTINDSLVEGYRKSTSEGLSQLVMSTGFGELFGATFANNKQAYGVLGGTIRDAFTAGGQISYNWIIRGFSDAASGKATGTATAAMSSMGGAGGGWMGAVMQSGALGGVGNWLNQPGFGNEAYQLQPGSNVPGFKAGQWITQGPGGKPAPYTGMTKGQQMVGAGQAALLGYSSYQSQVAGGGNQALAVASGVLQAYGMAAMMVGGPGGAVIGGVMMLIGTVMSMFNTQKGGTQTSVQTQTTEKQVASKIDVSNKKLELINRNLIALKNSLETYILPSSAYFSTARNLEDEFSLSARRG